MVTYAFKFQPKQISMTPFVPNGANCIMIEYERSRGVLVALYLFLEVGDTLRLTPLSAEEQPSWIPVYEILRKQYS